MPLSAPATRQRLHLRRVSYEGFRRDDGLFDIEARLVDTKDYDYPLSTGTRSKDLPVHQMVIRVTIDRRFEVVDIEASTEEMPYPGHCDQITPEYKQLIGSNLLKGFRKSIAEKMGGVKGCTHLWNCWAICRRLRCKPSLASGAKRLTKAASRFSLIAATRSPPRAKRCACITRSGLFAKRLM